MMWVAGMTTTSDQMSNNCYGLLNNFSEYTRDSLKLHEYLPFIEECNRLDPAVTFTFRLASDNIRVHDKLIEKGQTIFISNHAVKRDSSLFPRPDCIDLSRKAKHLSYGHGAHFCLGAKLASMEMQMAFYYLLKSHPSLKIKSY
jgi:cytochrome P450